MIVTRFAPSPTGFLHLGHALSAFNAWQRARQGGGRFLLRLEDIDPGRCRPEYADAIQEARGVVEAHLAWLDVDVGVEVVTFAAARFFLAANLAVPRMWKRSRTCAANRPRSTRSLAALSPFSSPRNLDDGPRVIHDRGPALPDERVHAGGWRRRRRRGSRPLSNQLALSSATTAMTWNVNRPATRRLGRKLLWVGPRRGQPIVPPKRVRGLPVPEGTDRCRESASLCHRKGASLHEDGDEGVKG